MISRQLVLVLKIISPVAGLLMSAGFEIRGNKTPFEVLCKSSIADWSATKPPMAVCADNGIDKPRSSMKTAQWMEKMMDFCCILMFKCFILVIIAVRNTRDNSRPKGIPKIRVFKGSPGRLPVQKLMQPIPKAYFRKPG